jgi:predicted SAM-dependent methyltransferase
MMKESCIHLGYYEKADGRHVPNPGMGQIGYVFSDHQHSALARRTWVWTETNDNNRPMDRASFDRFLKLPYVDLLYLRVEWCDIHKGPGKLVLPEAFQWIIDEVEKNGKRWTFRVMNSSPHSRFETSVPEFLLDKFEYETYWHNHTQCEPWPKKYPKYTEEYFKWWGELVNLAADKFDSHPLLEFSEIAGFGHWAEAHHYGSYTGPDGPIYNKDPEDVENVVERIISTHLNAFTKTPSVMNIHFTEYESGMKYLNDGQVWIRRDSFQESFSMHEWDNITHIKPGQAMLWEPYVHTVFKGHETTPPSSPDSNCDRMLDSKACYSTLGFNAWDAIMLHQTRVKEVERMAGSLGYFIRPTIVWRRYPENSEDQHVTLALVNDGSGSPPGTITLTAEFPSGKKVDCVLPKGEPAVGSRPLADFIMPREDRKANFDQVVKIRASIKLKEKSYPIQWAVKQFLEDTYELSLPLYEITDIGREVPLPGSNAPGSQANGFQIRYDRKGEMMPQGAVVGVQGNIVMNKEDLMDKKKS